MRTIIATVGLLLIGIATATIGSTEKGIHELRQHKKHDKSMSFDVDIDEAEVDSLITDFKDFGGKYFSKTRKERIALMKSLREAFKHTAAKMLLNWGRVFPPLASSWAEVMKHVQVDKTCDQECAVDCLDFRAGCETMYFNPTCLSKCRCKFAISQLDPEVVRDKVEKVTKDVENVNRFFKGIGAEDMKIIKPSYENYMHKAKGLHEEFGELVKEHAGKILGCDSDCLSDCLDRPELISFWEVPLCLKKC